MQEEGISVDKVAQANVHERLAAIGNIDKTVSISSALLGVAVLSIKMATGRGW